MIGDEAIELNQEYLT